MNLAVDLSELREITGGDPEVESEYFQIFFDSAALCMQKLSASTEAGHNQEWERAAHGFKGISLGLGALRLGELCVAAMNDFAAAPEAKAKMLVAIGQELARVHNQLKSF
jgi:HPt (histidine-containing phosphotransfer) domain-containing protein